jgi:hypothetical protein
MGHNTKSDDEFFRDQTASGYLDPLLTEQTMDLTQEALRVNKFTFKPLTTGQRRTVSQRLDELNVDPIAILAALAMGIDPRTGEPLIAVKPIKMRRMIGTNQKTAEPIMEDVIVNHEYPGATAETMAFCAKELASFVYPKLKHIEHKNDLDDRKTFTVIWAGEQPSWAKPRNVTNSAIDQPAAAVQITETTEKGQNYGSDIRQSSGAQPRALERHIDGTPDGSSGNTRD